MISTWTQTTREQHVARTAIPHINIEDEVFVETVGGDLTVKVEDNTEDGLGIYREDGGRSPLQAHGRRRDLLPALRRAR